MGYYSGRLEDEANRLMEDGYDDLAAKVYRLAMRAEELSKQVERQ